MPKFLIDENLSPLLVEFLRELGYDSVAVRDAAGLKGKSDREIVDWAKRNKRIIITCDKDFGEIYYLEQKGKIGIVILKSKFQSVNSYIKILKFLHREEILSDDSLPKSLIISSENRFRKYPSVYKNISELDSNLLAAEKKDSRRLPEIQKTITRVRTKL